MLIPVSGARVRCTRSGRDGTVGAAEGAQLKVTWSDRTSELRNPDSLRSGLQVGHTVIEQPSGLRLSLGQGVVVAVRTLGGREQVLTEFFRTAERHWLPWQTLKVVWNPETLYRSNVAPMAGSAERFRLRQLGRALTHWHGLTGSLAQVDIDPLPHQIHLVHRILSSGNLNWLIADDVGLGKTIEVGLLLHALRQRGQRRVLLVVPAGLTRQWQEELRERFGFTAAVIYGRDMDIHDPAHWRLYDIVIGSIDRFKHETHLNKLRESGPWDLVVFDEAHRLTRSDVGLQQDASERYRLASVLRGLTENLLLLSGTPHQGRTDRFAALLELLRPGTEWKRRIQRLRLEPQMLVDMVIRNRKSDVTDADGAFIFKGKVTRSVEAVLNEQEEVFDRALQAYLREGYAASRVGGTRNLAIGFVMTVYRKLAASSVAAIEQALERRLRRLTEEQQDDAPPVTPDEDGRFVESEEQQSGGRTEFFSGETTRLERLLVQARLLRAHDSKRQAFLTSLIPAVLAEKTDERVLIFTEYRSTQAYLVEALAQLGQVDVIHGGQSLDERRKAIEHFEAPGGQFLVSTEAGGEGFNLQRHCHVLVNYDLPWNPMRLVQRVGRLYRYGQTRPVVVFNMNVQGSLDTEILRQMYARLEAVASDMASVGEEYSEGLREDILGELASVLEVDEILAVARDHTPSRSAERLEAALERARQTAGQQQDLLKYASGFDPAALRQELSLSPAHLPAFVEGMFAQLGVVIHQRLHAGQVWDLRLPPALQQELGLNQNLRVAFDRTVLRHVRDVTLLDGSSPLLQALIRAADAYSFGGQVARVALGKGQVACAELAWQDESGRRTHQRFAAVHLAGGQISTNPAEFSEFLLRPAGDANLAAGVAEPWSAFEQQFNALLAKETSAAVHPDGWCPSGAAWAGPQTGQS